MIQYYMTFEVGKALLNKPRVNVCCTKDHAFVTDWAGEGGGKRDSNCWHSKCHSFENSIPLVGGCVT